MLRDAADARTVHLDTRDDALRCGEALSAVLLECTLASMATCTRSHLTELQSSRRLIGTFTGRAGMPQLLVRVGEATVLGEVPPRRRGGHFAMF